jgi:hypothetical protein
VADWDEDSPRLRRNLTQVLRDVRNSALRREIPTLEVVRKWQSDTMAGLDVPKPEYVGRFRGEPGVRATRVWIGGIEGTAPADVAKQIKQFEQRLQRTVAALDDRYPVDQELNADGVAAVIDLCAWAHSEWVRIHPFANGNGRTARLWTNSLLMRYGLPPAVRLRPRPDREYGTACARAMAGDWKPTVAVFMKMLLDHVSPAASKNPPSRGP